MFILISGISCTYFPMNAPEHWYYLGEEENNHINVLYFTRINDIAEIKTFFALALHKT